MRYSVRMMGKLSTAPLSAVDGKEIKVTDNSSALEPPEIQVWCGLGSLIQVLRF